MARAALTYRHLENIGEEIREEVHHDGNHDEHKGVVRDFLLLGLQPWFVHTQIDLQVQLAALLLHVPRSVPETKLWLPAKCSL